MTDIINTDDEAWNTRRVAQYRGCSTVTHKRHVRQGRYATPDFRRGPYAFWFRSTVERERAKEIAESAAKEAVRRVAQLEAADRAREKQRQKRQRECTATLSDT